MPYIKNILRKIIYFVGWLNNPCHRLVLMTLYGNKKLIAH